MRKNKSRILLFAVLVLHTKFFSQEQIKLICFSKQTVKVSHPRVKVKIVNLSKSDVFLPIGDFNDIFILDVKFENKTPFCTKETKRGYSKDGYEKDCNDEVGKNKKNLLKIKANSSENIWVDLSDKSGLACIELKEKAKDKKAYRYKIELNIPSAMQGNYCKQLLTGAYNSNEGVLYFK